jgi:hypothetical protein
MEDTPTETGDRLQTLVAILIALVALVGAIVAWRASVAADEAGGADFAGLNATLNAEQTRTLDHTNLYTNYRTYTTYLRYTELGNLLAGEMETAPEEEALILDQQRAEAYDSATAVQSFFPNRYLNPDGSYNLQRELGESWAEAGQEKDLNPEPHFQTADQMRAKSNRLIGVLIVLGVSLVFYTLADALNPALKGTRYSLITGGTLFMLISVIVTIMVEL